MSRGDSTRMTLAISYLEEALKELGKVRSEEHNVLEAASFISIAKVNVLTERNKLLLDRI